MTENTPNQTPKTEPWKPTIKRNTPGYIKWVTRRR